LNTGGRYGKWYLKPKDYNRSMLEYKSKLGLNKIIEGEKIAEKEL
jgi:hypothetical protein